MAKSNRPVPLTLATCGKYSLIKKLGETPHSIFSNGIEIPDPKNLDKFIEDMARIDKEIRKLLAKNTSESSPVQLKRALYLVQMRLYATINKMTLIESVIRENMTPTLGEIHGEEI